jgi:hypothetical protein
VTPAVTDAPTEASVCGSANAGEDDDHISALFDKLRGVREAARHLPDEARRARATEVALDLARIMGLDDE